MLGALLFVLPVAFLRRGAGDLKLLASLGAIGGPAFVLWSGFGLVWPAVFWQLACSLCDATSDRYSQVYAWTQRRVNFQLPAAISGCHMRCQSRLAPC